MKSLTNRSKQKLTTNPFYIGFPVLINHGPLVLVYLERMATVIENAIAEHPRTFAVRVDLRLPCGHGDAKADIMSRFTDSLKSQIRADLYRRDKRGRVHPCRLRYVWVKERNNSPAPHFHVVLLLNHDTYHTLGDFSAESGRNMASRIKKAWASAVGMTQGECAGLVEFPKNPTYRLNINADDFEVNKAALIRRLSYFAKLHTKEFSCRARSFGCSLL
jgi:hypothetical protein